MFRRFGVVANRIRLLPPFVPPSPPEAEYPPALKSFLSNHRPVLLSVGGLEAEYEIPLQVDALRLVRARRSHAGLVVVGSGSLDNELRALIAAQPHRGHILLCGDLPHAATLRLMTECDLLLRTSRYDGDSIAVREALHFGMPVIATDNGMRPDGVRLIPVGDLNALCHAIEDFSDGRTPRRPMATTKSQNNAAAVLEVYKELLAGVCN